MPKRTDANQRSIVEALREFGATVFDTHELGRGYVDLCVGFGGRSYLMEVKAKGGKLTEAEAKFRGSWRGSPIYIIHSVEEAIDIITEG
jgi:hypothetical protein